MSADGLKPAFLLTLRIAAWNFEDLREALIDVMSDELTTGHIHVGDPPKYIKTFVPCEPKVGKSKRLTKKAASVTVNLARVFAHGRNLTAKHLASMKWRARL